MSRAIRNLVLRFGWLSLLAPLAAAQPLPSQQPDEQALEPVDPATGELLEAGGPPAGVLLPANWFETRLEIEELIEAGDFAAAVALGDRLLELTAAEFGVSSPGLAEAHLLVAKVELNNGDFTAAEASVLNAIDIYETREGPLSPTLIDPYTDLGDTYGTAGDYAAALSSYDEARTIGRRNYGLLNEDQLGLIEKMTDAAEELGQFEEANELQLDALALVDRNHGEESLEGIEARYTYAAWLRRLGNYEEERRYYYQIERLIREHFDDDPLMNVRALLARAASYRREDNGDGIGLGGLRDAIEYLEEMEDTPPLLMAQVLLETGDWNVEFSRTGAIGDDYLLAWQWLGRVEDGMELRRQWFETLHEIEMSSISMRGLSTEPDAPRGFVDVYFTVDQSGRTRDLEITDSYPPGLKDGAVLRQYREARFRPRIENGRYVPSRHARRVEFRYDPLALE